MINTTIREEKIELKCKKARVKQDKVIPHLHAPPAQIICSYWRPVN
jgi:hypothetical protein